MFANRVINGFTVPCVVLYIIAVLAIVLYGYFLRKTGTRDVLATRIFDHPVCPEVDGWSVAHFVFFGILGFMYPGQHLQFLAVGVLWEVIESALGQYELVVSGTRLQLIGDQDEDGVSTGRDDVYWYGKPSDIIVDIAAYCVGSALAERYWPNAGEKSGPAAAPVGYGCTRAARCAHPRACPPGPYGPRGPRQAPAYSAPKGFFVPPS
jgi:hypothetical protein